jgi:hypothetical protein
MGGRNETRKGSVMKNLLLLMTFASLCWGRESILRVPPPPSGNAHSQISTGLGFGSNWDGSLNIQGNIDFYTTPIGCRFLCPRTYYHYIGTWDFQGNLVSYVDGSLIIPTPIATNAGPYGTWTVYAQTQTVNGLAQVGSDSGRQYHGFDDVPTSHFSWVTPNPDYHNDVQEAPYPLSVILTSDGDPGFPLNVSNIVLVLTTSGDITQSAGTAVVDSTDCQPNPVAVGSQCTINIIYDPRSIPCTGSYQNFAYTRLTVALTTDVLGGMPNWSTGFTINQSAQCSSGDD